MLFITIFQKYFHIAFMGFDPSALGQEMQGPNIVINTLLLNLVEMSLAFCN